MSAPDRADDMQAYLAEAGLVSGLADQMLTNRVLIDPGVLAAAAVEELVLNGDRMPGETRTVLRSLAAQLWLMRADAEADHASVH